MINSLPVLFLLSSFVAHAEQSVCFGTTAQGRLQDGVKLPESGANFTTYSTMATWLGRTYVHSQVKEIVLSAYETLAKSKPEKVYKYAETGFAEGGSFRPHKTHRNGLSVDFMVPVVNKQGKSVHLPTHLFNKFGYNIEFNADGQYEDYTIDYDALAAHIVALNEAAEARGLTLWRVIFAPEYQVNLYNTEFADYLTSHISFSKHRAWVRHDEHYHVDFDIPCREY